MHAAGGRQSPPLRPRAAGDGHNFGVASASGSVLPDQELLDSTASHCESLTKRRSGLFLELMYGAGRARLGVLVAEVGRKRSQETVNSWLLLWPKRPVHGSIVGLVRRLAPLHEVLPYLF